MTIKEMAREVVLSRLPVPEDLIKQVLDSVGKMTDSEIEVAYNTIRNKKIAQLEEQKRLIQEKIDAI